MMTPRENALATIHWEKAEYVPLAFNAFSLTGFTSGALYAQPGEAGPDPFGVNWLMSFGGVTPDPNCILFDDIGDWEKYVKFPRLDVSQFRAARDMDESFAPVDRKNKVVSALSPCGTFERLLALMGHENALCALLEDPEECARFFEADTDFRISCINKIIDAYGPDVLIYFDDIAMADSLFFSPETYRKMIKPHHKRIAEAVVSRGVIFDMHCCGKCEAVIDDFIDIGAKLWHSAQPMNDIAAILDKRGIVVEGGWDTSGPVSYMDSTDEEIREETRRCLTEYKKPGFILSPSLLTQQGNSLFVGDPRLNALADEWMRLRDF